MAFRSPQFPLGLSAPPLGPTTAGYRSLLALWVGGASSPPAAPTAAGFTSLLALWLGGASTSEEIIPPTPEPGTWGRISLKEVEIRIKEELFEGYSEEEQAAIFAAIAWTLK